MIEEHEVIEEPRDRGSIVILWGLGLSVAISALGSGHIHEGLHPFLQLLLIFLFGYHVALRLRTPAPPHPSASPPLAFFYPLGALLLLGLLSLATTASYALTVRHLHQWIGYAILAYLVACRTGPPGRKALIRLLVSLGGVVGLYGIYQHLWGFPNTLAHLEATGGDPGARSAFQAGRVFSTFSSPDMLAGYLAMIIPLGLAVLAGGGRFLPLPRRPRFFAAPFGSEEGSGRLWDKVWVAASLVAMLGALYLTRSLGGWLSLLAALGLWGVIGIRRGGWSAEQKKRARAGLLVLLAGGALLAGTMLWMRAPVFLDFSHPDNPLVQRWHYWGSAARIAADFPLTGCGLGTFGLLYPRYKPAMANETQYAHNGCLQLTAELGLPGLAVFLWIAFVFLQRGWQAVSHATPDERAAAWGLLAAGTAFLFHSSIDYGLSLPQVVFSWWAIFGLMAVQGPPAAGHRRPGVGGWVRERWAELPKSLSTVVVKGLPAALLFVLLGLVLSIGRGFLGRHYHQEARKAVQEGQMEEADLAIRRAIALTPLDDVCHYFSARLSADRMRQRGELQTELLERAVREYGRAIELNPYYSFYYRDRGLFYLGLGQTGRAIRDLSAAVDLYPTNGAHRYHLGLAYKSKGELERAEAELRNALRLQPNYGEALRELGWTLLSQRKIDAALPYFERLAGLRPRDAQARVDLGWAYAGLEQHRQALQEYEAALQRDPQHVYAWVNRGWSLYQLKEYPQAEEAYRKALGLAPDNPDARINLVLLYLQTGRREKARAELAEALAAWPEDPRLQRLRQRFSRGPGNPG